MAFVLSGAEAEEMGEEEAEEGHHTAAIRGEGGVEECVSVFDSFCGGGNPLTFDILRHPVHQRWVEYKQELL